VLFSINALKSSSVIEEMILSNSSFVMLLNLSLSKDFSSTFSNSILSQSTNSTAGVFIDFQMYADTEKMAIKTIKGIHTATRAFPLGL